MLERGSDAHQEDENEDRHEAAGKAEPDEAGARDRGADGQRQAFAHALGKQPRRNLEYRHCRLVGGADQRDLRISQTERLPQQRQEGVEHIHQPVVQHMHAADGSEGELRLALRHGGEVTPDRRVRHEIVTFWQIARNVRFGRGELPTEKQFC